MSTMIKKEFLGRFKEPLLYKIYIHPAYVITVTYLVLLLPTLTQTKNICTNSIKNKVYITKRKTSEYRDNGKANFGLDYLPDF